MPKLLTVEQTAEYLQVKPETVRVWLRNGTLPGVKLAGKVWRVDEDDLERWISEAKVQADKCV